MQIIEPSVEIIDELDEFAILKKLEICGRTAYKSEDRITPQSAERFVKAIIASGHWSVLEHAGITVRFIGDRGFSHELVRHRLASYTQESTRYCDYNKKGLNTVTPPCNTDAGALEWVQAVLDSERHYNAMIEAGEKPQIARSVLPISVKTEVVTTMNMREWRYVLGLRTQPDCHPQMRSMMCNLLAEFKDKLPVLFGNI